MVLSSVQPAAPAYLALSSPFITARFAARQAVDEADGPGCLEAGDLRLHERDDLLLEFGTRDGPRRGLDKRRYRLPHLRVGNADHRDVVDGRVQREHILGFLRVDVDAAGDDRERLAVGEEQEAVLVQVADVAEGGPVGVVPVLGGPGLVRVVVVGERDFLAPVDGRDVQAGPHRGPVHLEGAQVVLGQQGHHVSGPQARLVQHVRQLDRAPLKVPVAECLAAAGHDRRDPVRRLGRVRSWVHGPPPGSRFKV
jgi:hypothetical protein